ncbi:MAG: orotidine 5'-phosphate decarboxylase [Candidatus Mesenet longicola]|uniref:Orotidine 5'-phosphate decarboxylase n=1 Tax=Candidatus Mesenet longicola TaxID=1892558 RepID=A0A8J3MQD9_9RICK|nr:MAG: orotidine 5'-phosphate decarboxylase [Candidatus Mesenet longicola]
MVLKAMNPIICALDTQDIDQAVSLAKKLKSTVSMFKLGLEFFVANSISGVQRIMDLGIPIFLDLKLYDIPNTIAKTVEVIKSMNIAMLTLHLSGGAKMLKSALDAVSGSGINLVGVTVLTSMDNNDLLEVGINKTAKEQVAILAKIAKEVNLYGIVCSAWEIAEVRKICGNSIKIITPGIRLKSSTDDQKRTVTPKEAIELGADYIVIGRPITESCDPKHTVELILDSLQRKT